MIKAFLFKEKNKPKIISVANTNTVTKKTRLTKEYSGCVLLKKEGLGQITFPYKVPAL